MMLLVILLTMTVQTAWADGNPFAEYPGTGDLTITEPGTYDASGHIYGNLIINTSGEVILNVGNLTVQGNLQLNGGTLALYVHDGSHINAQDIPVVNTLYMDGGEITCNSIGFQSGTVSDGTINALVIGAAGTISGGTLTATNRFFAGASNYPTDYYLTITGGAISAPTFEILEPTTITAANASLSIRADTYDDYSGFALTLSGTRKLIDADNFNNIYDPGVLSVSAIAGKTLRPAYNVTFDEDGGSAVSDLTVASGSTISDPGSTKTGYTVTWYNGLVEYNFTAEVEDDLDLTAHWTENIATLDESATPLAELTAMNGKQTKVRFTRSGLTAGKYSTICLPYDFTASETCTFYQFDGVKKEGDDWVADISTTTGGTANTPYIFTTATATSVTFSNDAVNAVASYSDADAKTTITDWTFQGTYSQISLPKTDEYDYGFATGNGTTIDVGTFVHLVSGASAAPFRAYLKYTGSDDNWAKASKRSGSANDALPSRIIVRVVGADGGTTAIGTLDTRTGEISTGDWFDLNGRRLQGKPSTKGIYIHNGRKEVLK